MIAAKYSFTPNSLGYCGTSSFVSLIRSGNREKTIEELKKFHPYYAYLRLIARENNREPFDEDVVRAFWTGNGLLENVSHESLKTFILEELFPKGHPRAGKLSSGLPHGLVPHHSFNSLYINFVTDKVEKSIRNFDSCCVLPGKVLSVSGDSISVERHCIEQGPSIGKKREDVLLELNGVRFLERVEEGDLVSVHWGMAIERLTKEQEDSIIKYTSRNAGALRQKSKVPSA
jgi:hydrogenase maturation factor